MSCSINKNFSWSKETTSMSKELGLTKEQVIILASLVEKETKIAKEKPKIARVYLNRL